MHQIKLTYFKNNGKYYASGSYPSQGTHMGDWIDEVKKRHAAGDLPGLIRGARLDLILIEAGFPHILDLRTVPLQSLLTLKEP